MLFFTEIACLFKMEMGERERAFQNTLGTSIAAESPSPQRWDSLTSHSISAPFSLIQLLTSPSTGLCPFHPTSQPAIHQPPIRSLIPMAAVSQWEAKAFAREKPYCFHPACGVTHLGFLSRGSWHHCTSLQTPFSQSHSLLILFSSALKFLFYFLSFFFCSFSFSTPHALGSPMNIL